jgi:peptide/nickel transport system substrate-binding protein
VVRFTEPYPEQLYDATYHAPPLPAHLLEGIPPESLAASAFVGRPVGNGPYALARRSPGPVIELTANPGFFLGRPGIDRILLLGAKDPEARANLLLSGEVDAIDNIYSLPNWSRLERLPSYLYYPVPGPTLIYATFNQRDPADTARPHPIFTDPGVRRALVLALDREELVRGVYGPLARVPDGPLSSLLARSVDAPPVIRPDSVGARRLLAARGWSDHDGDGVLDKDGRPLAFRLLVPGIVAARVALASRMQEAWRRLGVRVDLDVVEGAVFIERRNAGRFDMDMYGVSQDPSPSGLRQSWSCSGFGGSNVMHYCDATVDSLLQLAAGSDRARAPQLYRAAMRRIAEDVPAVFLAALVFGTPVHRRFTNVVVRPESNWSLVWQWALRPGQAIDRDRQ